MATSYLPADIYAAQKHAQPCQIGGHTFWVNPWEFHVLEARIQYTVPTFAGPARFSYGLDSTKYTIQGFLGNAGLPELRGMKTFRPLAANTDTPYRIRYPFLDINDLIYIDSFERFQDQSMVNYIKYTISAQSYTVNAATFAPVPASVLTGSG